MQLGSLKPGDVVEVSHNGATYFAIYLHGKLSLNLRPIGKGTGRFSCRPKDVVGIWHANKATRSRVQKTIEPPAPVWAG